MSNPTTKPLLPTGLPTLTPASPSLESTLSLSTPQPTSTTSKGLATGAKAGKGIAAILGALLLATLIIFAFWYGKRVAHKKETVATFEKAELWAGMPGDRRHGKQELADTGIMEAEGSRPLTDAEIEFKKSLRVVELQGKPRRDPVEIG